MTPALYRWLTTVAAPLIRFYLQRRIAAGKEDEVRLGERFGVAEAPRPEGPLAWVHAASVGEAISALPLIERILESQPEVNVLMTTGTVSSGRLMGERLPSRARHQYVPLDCPDAVARFLDHWRPDLALWMESELWPNLVFDTNARAIPMVLVNGRMSRRSFVRWQRFPRLVAPMLAGFSLCLAQSDAEAERFRALGAGTVRALGNLKAAAPPLPFDQRSLAEMRALVSGRPIWLAASTHPGEATFVADAHQALEADHRGLLTIIVPRHPERAAAARGHFEAAGLSVASRSRGDVIHTDTQVYLADTLGELGLFYRLAEIVFIGGSLVPHGGQNPLEPARLGCVVIHGPHMFNFAGIVAGMAERAAAVSVRDGSELGAALRPLFDDTGKRRRFKEAAQCAAAAEAEVLDIVMAALAPYLVGLAGPDVSRARA